MSQFFSKEKVIIQVFYMFSAYTLCRFIPLASLGVDLLLLLTAVISNIVSMFFLDSKYSRIFRILNGILSFIVVYSLIYSSVKINHFYHYWLYVHILFSLSTFADFKRTLLYAQLIILSTYSLSGFFKILGIIEYCKVGICDEKQLSLTILDRILQTGNSPIFAEFFINHTYISFFSFIFVALFQFSAIFLFIYLFVYKKYKYSEIILITILTSFHILVALTLGIFFFDLVLLHALLFILPEALKRESKYKLQVI